MDAARDESLEHRRLNFRLSTTITEETGIRGTKEKSFLLNPQQSSATDVAPWQC